VIGPRTSVIPAGNCPGMTCGCRMLGAAAWLQALSRRILADGALRSFVHDLGRLSVWVDTAVLGCENKSRVMSAGTKTKKKRKSLLSVYCTAIPDVRTTLERFYGEQRALGCRLSAHVRTLVNIVAYAQIGFGSPG